MKRRLAGVKRRCIQLRVRIEFVRLELVRLKCRIRIKLRVRIEFVRLKRRVRMHPRHALRVRIGDRRLSYHLRGGLGFVCLILRTHRGGQRQTTS